MIEGSRAIELVSSLLPILGVFVGVTVALGLALATVRYFKPGDGDSHRSRWGQDALRIVAAGAAIAILASTNAGKAAFDYLGRGVTSYFEDASSAEGGKSSLMPSGDDYQVQQGQAREFADNGVTSAAEESNARAEATEAEIEENEASIEEVRESNQQALEENFERVKDSDDPEDLLTLFDGIDWETYSQLKEANEELYDELWLENWTTQELYMSTAGF